VESTVLTIDVDEAPQPYRGLDASVVCAVRVADLSVGYSPRQTKVDREHVAALADIADRLPPVVVEERTMTVIDGVHRLEAFRSLGRSHIPAIFFRGSDMEALVIAIQANIQHGKPLSRTERQEAARALLFRYPDRSDRWVGEVCGVSHTTVAVLRRSVSTADARVRTGRDGRRRPVDPSLGQAAVARVMAENPTASIRQAAGAAGVAPSTVQRVAAGLARSERSAFVGASITIAEPAQAPAEGLVADPVYHSFPEGAEAVTWLARTAVSVEDLHAHLGNLPLSRVYQIADECRRRASTWAQMADALEARVRRGLPLVKG
jgi:ParB-like chromosome segregation protein Spo0J